MSFQHWRSTLKHRPDLAQDLQPLLEVAKQYQKPITIFDLEATTLLGKLGFGITEIGMVHINPTGEIATSGGLVNPENRISREAVEITGITNDMVKDQKNWKDGWGEVWTGISQKHIVAGYNTATFDIPATIHQHQRYHLGDLSFAHNWDIFRMKNHAYDTKRGTLAEVARWLDLEIDDFNAHRATDDAIMTARVMARLIERYPQSLFAIEVVTGKNPSANPLLQHLVPQKRATSVPRVVANPSAAKTSATAVSGAPVQDKPVKSESMTSIIQRVLHDVAQDPDTDWKHMNMHALAQRVLHEGPHLQKSPDDIIKSMSFAIGAMMDKGEIPLFTPRLDLLELFGSNDVRQRICALWQTGDTAGKLAPVHAYLQEHASADYMDVRWVLNAYGLRPCGKLASAPSTSAPLQP